MSSDAACHSDREAQDAYASDTNWTCFMASAAGFFFFPFFLFSALLFLFVLFLFQLTAKGCHYEEEIIQFNLPQQIDIVDMM